MEANGRLKNLGAVLCRAFDGHDVYVVAETREGAGYINRILVNTLKQLFGVSAFKYHSTYIKLNRFGEIHFTTIDSGMWDQHNKCVYGVPVCNTYCTRYADDRCA